MLALARANGAQAAHQWGWTSLGGKTTSLGPIGDGRRAFLEYNCYICHGNRAEGAWAPNIQHALSSDVANVINFGAPAGMPVFSKYVNATGIADITAYLGSIGTASEPTWVDWWNAEP